VTNFLEISTVGYPDSDLQEKINKLREVFAAKFNSKKAIIFKPHITIAERVLIPKDRLDDFAGRISVVCRATQPITSNTSEMEFVVNTKAPFDNPYVVWIAAVKTKEFVALNRKIDKGIYEGLKRPSMKSSVYRPHFTLAYRDLTKDNFEKAKEYFSNKKYDTKFEFTINSLHWVLHKSKDSAEDIREFNFQL
jgi:2'-5' RNA ligase